MLKTEGSNAQVNLIEFLQRKNGEIDPDYVPQAFHKPDKSLLRRWVDFFNPFHHPMGLKPCDGLNPGIQRQSLKVEIRRPNKAIVKLEEKIE